ncbi:RecQ family ATP-dependent DNA helicase [Salinirubellus salinus]|uniref:DNA 3'-5' helicase n=1 Tax=Salinirubellus salinus TaxID=1364945 RepID=A0A9E7R702_9EURY|nr:RecQ family ATP-dependent DNA helicase [Salinirubellus salinus]UWM56636.1 RecQ family ATP-dependent DNA helicase [Salinirubellus salinus]
MTRQGVDLTAVPGVDDARAAGLRAAGFETVYDVADADGSALERADGVEAWLVPGLRQAAKERRGDLDTVFVAVAAETRATRDEVFDAFAAFAADPGPFATKVQALHARFGEVGSSIFDLETRETTLDALYPFFRAGFERVEDVADASVAELAATTDVDRATAGAVRESALAHLGREEPAPPAPEPEGAEEEEPDTTDRAGRDEALALLRAGVGSDAEFRPDQWEAIDALVNDRARLLLVQRTGWGKSSVYFIATRLLRAREAGPTLIVSPLLALMRNQVADAAAEFDLRAETINSNNEDEWEAVTRSVVEGTCDLLLVSPERLANREFQRQVLGRMEGTFGMLVVDEAHCISDWGHDFRPDYRRIRDIIARLDPEVPVAATTATANDRVVDDITDQLPELRVLRGSLLRESLQLQAMDLGSRERRLAWLAENIDGDGHSGIVYCLTVRDAELVASWLTRQGLDVRTYHGGLDGEERRELERLLLEDEVDALAATSALGMGFNKPDLGFVIHFQRPPNLIRYYQEIGRAGRNLDRATAVLLAGEGDDDIAEYFIESAFPSREAFEAVLEAVEANPDTVHQWNVYQHVEDVRTGTARTCLDILDVEGAISRRENGFVRTEEPWHYDGERYEAITEQRWAELDRIDQFVGTDACLMRFIAAELDGELEADCGRCANCRADDVVPRTVEDESLVEAAVDHFRAEGRSVLSPRKMTYTEAGRRTAIDDDRRLEPGRALSAWDDPAWGDRVQAGVEAGRFDDDLVAAAADLVRGDWNPDPAPEWVAAVPSASTPGLVEGVARRLAARLDRPFVDCVAQVGEKASQRDVSGSTEQCANVRGAFAVDGRVPDGPVLLVDDTVGSRWTLTEVGGLLREAGSGAVYPLALARR